MEKAYQESIEARPAQSRQEEVRTGRESLVARLGSYCRQAEEAPPFPAPAVICADGYIRRTPVQPYYISPDYIKRRRRFRLAVMGGSAAVIAAILIAVVMLVL